MNVLLTEKYRPQKVEDVVGFDPRTFAIDETLPHLLFHGPQGTGKTTLAKVIVKTLGCDYIILNSSEERGIDVVRNKILTFATTKSSNGNIKLCILDEFDYMTPEAQTSMRNLMETYSATCRFVLTCNYLQKIILPIQSRCILVKFDTISKQDIVNRMEYICKTEKIPYEVEALKKIVDQTGTDIRAAINKIEEFKDGVRLDRIKNESKLAEEVFTLLKKGDFILARQKYLDKHPDPEQFIKNLYDVVFESNESKDYKQSAILAISEEYRWISQVAWKEILIESLMLKLMSNMVRPL
jgi:replication factor C small subunit